MTNSFYRRIDQWATPNLAVVPLSKGKPCKGSPFKDLWGKLPLESRKSLFDANFRDNEGNGAALLTTGPSLRICFVDVDDPSKLDQVRRWLREKTGATYFVEVTSGRGAHIYFRMEDHQTYTTGPCLKWGEFTDSRGVHACVDLRGEGSTAIMPGSVYDKRDKGGILTVYRWGGRFAHLDFELPPFEEFVAALPVLTKALWDEMAGPKVAEEAGEAVEVDWSSDPLWAKIDPNARNNQICPVCGHETLKKSKIRGAMACFHSDCKGSAPARIYRPVDRTKKAIEKEAEEYEARQKDPLIGALVEPNVPSTLGSTNAPPEPFEDQEDMAWQGFRAQVLADFEIPADPDDLLMGYDFAEGDPCHGLGPQALKAEKLARGRWTWKEITKCHDTATVRQSLWSPKTSRGSSRQVVPSCWRYSCDVCGPLLLKALNHALLAWSWFKVGPGALVEPNVPSTLGSTNAWNSGWVTLPSLGEATRLVLKRHAAKHEGAFHWLGIASTPSETQILIFWRNDAGPKKGTPLWDLFEDSPPLMGEADEILSEVFNTIDLEVWRRARLKEEESRIVLLLGPSQMLTEVKALHDWLTTHNRGPAKPGLKRWEPPAPSPTEQKEPELAPAKVKLKPEHKGLLALLKKREKQLEQDAKDHAWLVREFAKDAAKAAAEEAKKEKRKTRISIPLVDDEPYITELRRLMGDSKLSSQDTGWFDGINPVRLLEDMLADGRVVAAKQGHRRAKKIYIEGGRVDLLID